MTTTSNDSARYKSTPLGSHNAFPPVDTNAPPPAVPRRLSVCGYSPREGEPAAPLIAQIDFFGEENVYVRLVVGNKPIGTQVKKLGDDDSVRWQLEATVPPFDSKLFPSARVPITVQALTCGAHRIIDSMRVGDFQYRDYARALTAAGSLKHPRSDVEDSDGMAPAAKRSAAISSPETKPASNPTIASPPRKLPQPKTSGTRKAKRVVLVRRTQTIVPPPESENLPQKPVLDIVTPLEYFAGGWDHAELASGRRLIRVKSVLNGTRLRVTCDCIKQKDYQAEDIVISCIYNPATERCIVTSADIIYLLENLVGSEFEVEEKNRIRRNLEGLKPTTIFKNKLESKDFFQRIMAFPDPRPRKIEKDLKVFDWHVLGVALNKIMSRYSLHIVATDSPSRYVSVIRPPPSCKTASVATPSKTAAVTEAVLDLTDTSNVPPPSSSPPQPIKGLHSFSGEYRGLAEALIPVPYPTRSSETAISYTHTPIIEGNPFTALSTANTRSSDGDSSYSQGSQGSQGWSTQSSNLGEGDMSLVTDSDFVYQPDFPMNHYDSQEFELLRYADQASPGLGSM
ncbi:hypothetical protein PLICRDRAFT_487803 [Plicaturopsis crispa FD-325 SS-3]|nr:hypothetical protein PLICRDRAFT_487803 [Plicaturopsis crispa FD-325 SS-3]